MGIDHFHTWLKANYDGCFSQPDKKNIYDFIYIDVNHILHNSIYKSPSEANFIKRVFNHLDLIFSNFIARKGVILVVDGPAPYAKIILQRRRRLSAATSCSINLSAMNALHLTPGTELMLKLKDYLKQYATKLLDKSYNKNLRYYISSTEQPDEGEIKIIKKVIKFSKLHPNSSHLIVSNDADLLVLTMNIRPVINIHVLIKTAKQHELISLEKLVGLFYKKVYRIDKDVQIDKLKDSTIRDDFVLISLMAGNDYLPKLHYTRMPYLWEAYMYIKRINKGCSFIKDNNYDVNTLKMYFTKLMLLIPNRFASFDLKKNPKIVADYLEGLLWCFNMYQTGYCPKYDYCYEHKHAPTPQDILYYLEFNSDVTFTVPRSNVKPVPVGIYTILSIPYQAKSLIPLKYHNTIETQLKHVYVTELCGTCDTFKKDMNKLQKQLKQDDGNEEIQNKINKLSTSLSKHKKTHTVLFSVDDINKIVQLMTL